MRRLSVVAAAALSLGAAAALRPLPTAEGPPLGYTGGFGEPTCTACHIDSAVNSFGGRVGVQGLPTSYQPGAVYLITVVLEAEETSVAGFELAARFADGPNRGANAGALVALDPRVGVGDSLGVSYAHQTRAGSRPSSPDGASWSLRWTAPASGGPVAFHVVANSGNADNSPLSDLVYADEVTVGPGR